MSHPQKRILRFLGTAALVTGVFLFQVMRMDGTENEAHAEMHAEVQSIPHYAENSATLDRYFETAHDRAFSEAYVHGSRRRRAHFDRARYEELVVPSMMEQAATEGRSDLTEVISALLTDAPHH